MVINGNPQKKFSPCKKSQNPNSSPNQGPIDDTSKHQTFPLKHALIPQRKYPKT